MSFYRYHDGLVPNTLAIGYTGLGYCTGWWLVCVDGWLFNLAGVLLLAHAMVIAAYLVHECAHNTLFTHNEHNAILGNILLWITGSCYGTYEGIRHKHFRHHVDRADVCAFNFRQRLLLYPRILFVLQTLERIYIPALDILMHWMVPFMPFVLPGRRNQRVRVLVVLIIRTVVFAAIAFKAPKILLLYPLSYMLMLHILRFMDAFQHTYALFETLEQPRGPEASQFDAAFEYHHTYSNLHSQKYPWLNLFTLNFGYHNAHHEKPIQPWYRLPTLNQELFGEQLSQLLPFRNQLSSYFRYRVQRITHEDPVDLDVLSNGGATFVGVIGVSFLTGH